MAKTCRNAMLWVQAIREWLRKKASMFFRYCIMQITGNNDNLFRNHWSLSSFDGTVPLEENEQRKGDKRERRFLRLPWNAIEYHKHER